VRGTTERGVAHPMGLEATRLLPAPRASSDAAASSMRATLIASLCSAAGRTARGSSRRRPWNGPRASLAVSGATRASRSASRTTGPPADSRRMASRSGVVLTSSSSTRASWLTVAPQADAAIHDRHRAPFRGRSPASAVAPYGDRPPHMRLSEHVRTPGRRLGVKGSAGSILSARQDSQGPFRRNSERLLTASRGGLTTIRSLSSAEARVVAPSGGTSPDRAPSASATRCAAAPRRSALAAGRPLVSGHARRGGAAPPF
jgi:hypothetical protein